MGVTLILQARYAGISCPCVLTEVILWNGSRTGHENASSDRQDTHLPCLATMLWTDKFNPLRSLKQQYQVHTYSLHCVAYASRWSQESVRDRGGSHGSHGTCVPGKPCLTRWRIFHRAEYNFRGPFEPFLSTPPVIYVSRLYV